MRDSKPRVVERELLDQVSEEVLVDPMQNNEVVRPVEVVDQRAHTDVVEWLELIEIRPSSVT